LLEWVKMNLSDYFCTMHVTFTFQIEVKQLGAVTAGLYHKIHHVTDIVLYGCHLGAVLATEPYEEQNHTATNV